MQSSLKELLDSLNNLVPLKKTELPEDILKQNGISILTLDERWNVLWKNIKKPPAIVKCEDKITGLLKKQAKLTGEKKECAREKKVLLKRIVELSAEAYEDENDSDSDEALKRIDSCREKIEEINAHFPEIDEKLTEVAKQIIAANIELLESAVSHLYFNIEKAHKRIVELEGMIADVKSVLMDYVEEKEVLAEAFNEAYSCFHDLLGAEQVSELDKLFGFE